MKANIYHNMDMAMKYKPHIKLARIKHTVFVGILAKENKLRNTWARMQLKYFLCLIIHVN